ncbi:MAG TPA: hypothetical protein VFN55_10065 [Solirubrobacteraceae bacterium]|nr:hypothetical protein [Solirubrobacteraceae bacterium]
MTVVTSIKPGPEEPAVTPSPAPAPEPLAAHPTPEPAAPGPAPARPAAEPTPTRPAAEPVAARPAFNGEAWARRWHAVTGWIGRHLARPRVRLAVIGVALLVVAVFGITSSVWTLPLVIIGAAMVLIAWIGSRLEGRFAVEWGEAGTQLEFRAQIKAPPAHMQIAAPAAPPAARPAVRVPTLTPINESASVIEGEAHTVEIDVAELKALICAAEANEARGAPAQTDTAPGAGHRDAA